MLKHASFVALLAVAASAQAPVAPTGPRLVMVDVVALNGKEPVKDLKKEDFVIEDKGKKVTPVVLQIATPDQKAPDIKGSVASNRMTFTGQPLNSATLILFDRLNTPSGDQATVRRQVLDMLSKLNPNDHVGVFSLGLGLTPVRDYYEDAGPLAAVAKAVLQGGSIPDNFTAEQEALYKALTEATTPIQEQQNQTRVNITFPAFRMLARHLAGFPGRKNLVWITSSFPLTYGNQATQTDPDAKSIGVDKSQNTGNERRTNDEAEISTFKRVLYESGVALYPMQTGGAGASFASAPKGGTTLTGAQTFEGLAQDTGGKAFLNANDITPLLREVLALPAYTYSVGFYPDAKSFDDRDHNLKISLVKGPNDKAKLTYRKEYYAWAPKGQAGAILKPGVVEIMEEPTLETGIGLMAVANPEAGKQALHLRIDANDIRWVQEGGQWTASFDVAMALDGSRNGGNLETFSPKLTTEQLTQALKEGLDIRKTLETGNSSAIIRIAVQDKNTGNAGSVRLRYAAQ